MFRNLSRRASSSSSSSCSGEDEKVTNGHGFHEGCCCEKCDQRFFENRINFTKFAFKTFVFRKKEKRMLYDYNNKLQALIREKVNIIRQLERENNTIKEFKEVIIR